MTLSKRERWIAIAAAAVIGLLGLDRFVVTPWLASRRDLAIRLEAQHDQMRRSERTFVNLRRANRRWSELAGSTLATNAPAAEGQLLNHVRDWAQASGLTLTAVRPDRTPARHGFEQITIRAAGTGRFEQLTSFLWNLETTELPVRLTEFQIASREPGTDDLTVQIAVATIFLPVAKAEGGATP